MNLYEKKDNIKIKTQHQLQKILGKKMAKFSTFQKNKK